MLGKFTIMVCNIFCRKALKCDMELMYVLADIYKSIQPTASIKVCHKLLQSEQSLHVGRSENFQLMRLRTIEQRINLQLPISTFQLRPLDPNQRRKYFLLIRFNYANGFLKIS